MPTAVSDRELALLDADELAAGVRIVFDEMALRVEDGVVVIANDDGTVSYRWRCTVCGYVHEAPEPPRWCPLCGADRDQFVRDDEAA